MPAYQPLIITIVVLVICLAIFWIEADKANGDTE